MTLLFSVNIVAAILLLLWPTWFARTLVQLPWINPLTIALAISLPVDLMIIFGGPLSLIEDGLFDFGYQYALLMTNIFALAQMLGAVFFFFLSRSLGIHRYLPFQEVLHDPRGLRNASYLFLSIYFFAFFMLASAELGVLNWVLNPRDGYQFYRAGQGHWYAIANSALSVSFALSLLARPRPLSIIFKTGFYLALGYLLGAKGMLLAIFTTGIIFLWFIRWRYFGVIIFLFTPFIFAIMLFNLYLSLGDSIEISSLIAYFDHFKNGADYYRSYLNDEIDLFYGELLTSTVWAYVPRGIWPEKPFVYGVTLVNEIFYPGQAALTHTPAFGGAVEQFADFGPLGVILFGFFSWKAVLTGLLSYLIFRRPGLSFNRITLSTIFLILMQYAPAFGVFLPFGLYILQLVFILTLLFLLFRSNKRRNSSC